MGSYRLIVVTGWETIVTEDIRWKQRFSNFLRAMENLRRAVDLARSRELSELEQQGLIQSFEFTHELAWNVLKDFLESEGYVDLPGSRTATRIAFENGLISDGSTWMEMIQDRNYTSHTYNMATANLIVGHIISKYYGAFEEMERGFRTRQSEERG